MDWGILPSGWSVAAILSMVLMAKSAQNAEDKVLERLERRAALAFATQLPSARWLFVERWALGKAALDRIYPDWPAFRDRYIAQNAWGAE